MDRTKSNFSNSLNPLINRDPLDPLPPEPDEVRPRLRTFHKICLKSIHIHRIAGYPIPPDKWSIALITNRVAVSDNGRPISIPSLDLLTAITFDPDDPPEKRERAYKLDVCTDPIDYLDRFHVLITASIDGQSVQIPGFGANLTDPPRGSFVPTSGQVVTTSISDGYNQYEATYCITEDSGTDFFIPFAEKKGSTRDKSRVFGLVDQLNGRIISTLPDGVVVRGGDTLERLSKRL